MAALGAKWRGVVTKRPRPDTTSGSAEFYAVVWRTERAALCDGWTGLRIADDVNDDFSREPAFTCLRIGKMDLLLAAYH